MRGWEILTILVLASLSVSVNAYRKPWKQRHRCEWVRCEPPCRKVKGDDGCFKCDCEPLCSPPKCDPGCEIQKEFDGPCPGCECKKDDFDDVPAEMKKKICEPVKCGYPCKEVPPETPEECPKCVCDEMDVKLKDVVSCDPPKCDPGCVIEKVFDGPCPGCDCKGKGIGGRGDKPGDIVCDPPKCPPGCFIQKKFDGPCPGCDCKDEFKEIGGVKPGDIACDPPKCPPGCFIQKKFDGPCPGCDCKDEVKEIGGGFEPDDIACDPPKCPPGCLIQKKFDGPCPGCDCKDKELKDEEPKIVCDPPKCPEGCKIETDFEGPCPECDCFKPEMLNPRKAHCSPPKCKPGCFIQKEFDGPCPGCECPEDDVKDKKICPDVEYVDKSFGKECDGPGCKLEKDENGCDICKCMPECTPPKCRRYCVIKEVEGGCPVCECPKRRYGWKHKRD